MTKYGRRLHGREIRILTLLPGRRSSPLQCSLSQAWLSDNPVYDALSYVWGDPKNTRHITIDGTQRPVTANLESALHHLRREESPLKLWVDAICINQEDTEERNAQVNIMSTIYSTARLVFIWIGTSDELSDAAFDSMPAVAQGQVDDRARHETFSFYLSLQERPWFSRIWIIQELALAREDPIVVCGWKQAPWSMFMSTWKVLAKPFFTEIGMTRQREDNGDVEIVGSIKIDNLDELRSAVRCEQGQTMPKLLIEARTSECTDLKDNIYGLLGMLNVKDRASYPVIDYCKSIVTIYSEAVAHVFAKGQGPRFLSGMWLPGINPQLQGLPSWSIDFSQQTAGKLQGPGNYTFCPPHPWTASGAGAQAVNGTVLDDGLTLRIESLPVDVVEIVIQLPNDLQQSILRLHSIQKLADECRERTIVEDPNALQLNIFKKSEPLWRTLTSNRNFGSGYGAAPDQFEADFAELLAYSQDQERIMVATGLALPDNAYVKTLRSHLPGRAFFSTANGFVGLASSDISPGDEVTIWFGAIIPFITRPKPSEDGYCQLVSGAYVAGIMQGEMVDELYCEDLLDSKTLLVR